MEKGSKERRREKPSRLRFRSHRDALDFAGQVPFSYLRENPGRKLRTANPRMASNHFENPRSPGSWNLRRAGAYGSGPR
jgi:hypothetical protein